MALYYEYNSEKNKTPKMGRTLSLIYIIIFVAIFIFSKGCGESSCAFFSIAISVLALPLSIIPWILDHKYDYFLIFLGFFINIFLIYFFYYRWEEKRKIKKQIYGEQIKKPNSSASSEKKGHE